MKVEFEEGESFLRKVHLTKIPCSLEIKMRGVIKETLKFRFLTPQISKGHWGFEKDIVTFIVQMLGKTEGEEKRRCAHLLRMMRFHKLFPPHEQMRGRRRFHIDWSHPRGRAEATTWFEIAKGTGIRGVADFVAQVTKSDKITSSSEELLKQAIYREPKLQVLFSEESYYRHRKDYLTLWETYDQFIRVGAEKMFKGEQNPTLNRFRKKRSVAFGKARKSLEECQIFLTREFFREEQKDHERAAETYKATLKRALGLHKNYRKTIKEGGSAPSVSSFLREFDSLVNDYIDELEADTKREGVLRISDKEIRTTGKECYIAFLRKSVVAKDISAKWSGLLGMIENLTYRGDAVKLLQREAESVCLGLVTWGINEIYRKIRKSLAAPEKRAFILAHYRQYRVLGGRSPICPFGGRILRLEPIIWDFFREMGESTAALIYAVLIFKYAPSFNERKTLQKELRERWRRYLFFYPSWERITRLDERGHKREQQWHKRTISLSTPIRGDRNGNIITLEDELYDEGSVHPFQARELKRKEAEQLIDSFCTPREAEILKLVRLDGYTLKEVANKIGEKEGRSLTHQAISRTIAKAIRAIVERCLQCPK